jgi:hypothetical protein
MRASAPDSTAGANHLVRCPGTNRRLRNDVRRSLVVLTSECMLLCRSHAPNRYSFWAFPEMMRSRSAAGTSAKSPWIERAEYGQSLPPCG